MKLQGFIFDIDGTLVDSNDGHARCWLEAFEHFGKQVDYDVMRHQIGKGGDLLVPDLLDAKEMRKFGDELEKYRSKLYKDSYMQKVKPFPGAADALRALHERGVKISLASSANPDEVKHYTELLGVGDLLDASTSKGDAKMSKPSPEIFKAALEQGGSDDKFTVVVGDTPYDILAAHRIALPIIAVLCGGFERELLARAEFIFENVSDIVPRLNAVDQWFE